MKKYLLLFIIMLLCLAGLTSCGGGASDEVILNELEELAPKAKELYDIIYGDGLAHGEPDESGYAKVSDEAKYKSENEIVLAMLEVFTPEYYQILSNVAFKGVSVDEGAIAEKFYEKDGILYVNPSVTADFGEIEIPDLKQAKVIKKNRYMAIVEIPVEDSSIEVTLRLVDGSYRIDSPIF